MKRWKDPFPQTPKGFHDRVEQTLGGLEDTDMRLDHHYRRLKIALAAALIAVLAMTAAAVAVVLGSARFKQALTDSGADEVAALVEKGAQTVSLGPRILRTETAGMAMVAQILFELGE